VATTKATIEFSDDLYRRANRRRRSWSQAQGPGRGAFADGPETPRQARQSSLAELMKRGRGTVDSGFFGSAPGAFLATGGGGHEAKDIERVGQAILIFLGLDG
jgi:hypothetical protein